MKYKFKISPFVLTALSAKEKGIYTYSETINKIMKITPFKINLEKYHT